jgi:hypothetical protein
MSADPFKEGQEAATARKRRSIAIALMCVAFVALVFITTAVQLQRNRAAPEQAPAEPASGAGRR